MQVNTENGVRSKTSTQTLILSDVGVLVESCDSIFPTHNFICRQISEWSPFLTGIFESLRLLPDQRILILPRITTIANNVEGVFDCLFEKGKEGENTNYIIWRVKDITKAMKRCGKIQQVYYSIHWDNYPQSVDSEKFNDMSSLNYPQKLIETF